jgi:glycosyltransferase involved in cell wall biosynthesis
MASVAIIHNHPIHYQHLLFCELARRQLDFEVLFLAASSGVRMQAPLPANGEYPYSIGHTGSYETAPTIGTGRFVWHSLNRIRPAVVILCGWADAAMWTGWLWAERHGAARILWAESNSFDHQRWVWRELPKRLFVRRCNAAHVYGTSSRAYVEHLGMAGDRIYTKRAIANTALFLNYRSPEARQSGPIRLLFCGRLAPEKNLAMLLRAFAGLEQSVEAPRMLLRLVGHGPLEAELRGLARELKIEKLVEFYGSASQTDLPAIYCESDILILPSTSEPWGLVVNEAMLSRLPVAVSTNCGCVADLVNSRTGWTFSPYDERELTKLLARIATTPRRELEQMGRAGYSLASEYSPENCALAVIKMANGLTQSLDRDRSPAKGAQQN